MDENGWNFSAEASYTAALDRQEAHAESREWAKVKQGAPGRVYAMVDGRATDITDVWRVTDEN